MKPVLDAAILIGGVIVIVAGSLIIQSWAEWQSRTLMRSEIHRNSDLANPTRKLARRLSDQRSIYSRPSLS